MAEGIINKTMDNTIQGVDPSINISAGLPPNDPGAQNAMQNAMKMRGGDIARGAIMGAGMGAQAGQGQLNPVSAYLQGAAAGLQAPAMIYEEKAKQAKDIRDSMPFGAVVPDAKNIPGLQAFVGLPYGLVAPAIAEIAKQSVKAYTEGEQARTTEAAKTRITAENASNYASLYKQATGKDIDPDTLIGVNETELKEYMATGGVDMSKVFANEKSLRDEFSNQVKLENFSTIRDQYFNLSDASKKGNAAGDMKMIFSYMKMLDPNSIVRESEYATAQNAAGIPSRIVVAYNKAIQGESLSPKQRSEFMDEAKDIWKRKTSMFKSTVDTYRTLAKNSGFDPNRVVTNIGNVIAYTDPNSSNYIPLEATPSTTQKHNIGDVFSESSNGYISTYKIVDVNGKLGRKRISVVEDTKE